MPSSKAHRRRARKPRRSSRQATSVLVLDTGALIALDRGQRRTVAMLDLAETQDIAVRTPGGVVTEFWRGQHRKSVQALIEAAYVPETLARARRAGEALANVSHGPSPVDATVAALAAELGAGAEVLTSDPEDFESLRSAFPGLRIRHLEA